MASTVFPAPSTASASVPNWVLVSRSTSSAVTYNFTGLSGYKNYKLVWSAFRTTSGGEQIQVRINGVTTGAYGASTSYITPTGAGGPNAATSMNDTYYTLTGSDKTISSAQDQGPGFCLIEGADSTTGGKLLTSEAAFQSSGYKYYAQGVGSANIAASITSILFGAITGSGTLNPAFVELWGAN